MRKPILLTGRTEILAAIYNPDYLPSAVMAISDPKGGDPRPHCLHSFREEDLSFFEATLVRAKEYQNLDASKPETDEQVKAWVYPFFEDYPGPDHTCNGCYYGDKLKQHKIRNNELVCTKSTEACA